MIVSNPRNISFKFLGALHNPWNVVSSSIHPSIGKPQAAASNKVKLGCPASNSLGCKNIV